MAGIAGLKSTMFDEALSCGKAASISAESFAQQIGGLQSAMNAHDESLGGLQTGFKSLEQQVKAIARVMASQNIQKITENIKLSQDDLRRSLTQYVNEKSKETISQVQREVHEVADAKSGLGKKIDTVEQRIMSVVGAKIEEASTMRHAMKEELERIKDMMENVPDIAEKNSKLIKGLEAKINELKLEFRNFEREQDKANLEQDKQVTVLTSEIRTTLSTGMDKLAEESKALGKSIRKHEGQLEEKLKNVYDMLEKETVGRVEACKTTSNLINESISKLQLEFEKKISRVEPEMERLVRPFVSSVQEVRRMVEEETVHRDTRCNEIARNLTKEISDRHHDDERMISLITVCQATMSKMHKSAS